MKIVIEVLLFVFFFSAKGGCGKKKKYRYIQSLTRFWHFHPQSNLWREKIRHLCTMVHVNQCKRPTGGNSLSYYVLEALSSWLSHGFSSVLGIPGLPPLGLCEVTTFGNGWESLPLEKFTRYQYFGLGVKWALDQPPPFATSCQSGLGGASRREGLVSPFYGLQLPVPPFSPRWIRTVAGWWLVDFPR